VKTPFFKKILSRLPDAPGVYFFLGKHKEVLYIGKATSLRDRVRSYFVQDLLVTRGPKLQLMIERARNIKWQTTDSALEALLLESYLIKKHQPPYNTDEKDDKSYSYVVITKEKFPRVLLMRGKDLFDERADEGDFSTLETFSGTLFSSEGKKREKVSRESAVALGRRKVMKLPSSASLTYRKASFKYIFGPFPQGGSLREALKIVRRIFPFRDKCVLAESIDDSSKIKPCFNHQIGLCPGVCAGKITAREYAKTIRNIKLFFEGKKARLVRQIEKEMKEAAKRLEFEKAGELKNTLFALGHIQDVSLLKNDWREHVLSLDQAGPSGAVSLDDATSLTSRIEAYDAAHMAGKDVVGVMVVMEDGVVNKQEYRQFKIRVESANDLANLEEVLTRRFTHQEWRFPTLIVVDGFDLQIKTAQKVLSGIGIEIPVVGVVKDERHKPREILGPKDLAEKYRDQILLANSEAHRFAIQFHRKRRAKTFLRKA
jgi:excinuclease UvrABC nuclease subunit